MKRLHCGEEDASHGALTECTPATQVDLRWAKSGSDHWSESCGHLAHRNDCIRRQVVAAAGVGTVVAAAVAAALTLAVAVAVVVVTVVVVVVAADSACFDDAVAVAVVAGRRRVYDPTPHGSCRCPILDEYTWLVYCRYAAWCNTLAYVFPDVNDRQLQRFIAERRPLLPTGCLSLSRI